MTGERLQGKTNLMTACEQGRALEAKIILQKKPQSIAFRDKHGKTALHYCAESGALPCAQLLVSGADRTLLDAPDSEGFTPLHLAVISGHKSIARLLLRAGADPDSVDKERHSVVHWAAVCGDTESLELLLGYGANPSTPDILGAYPIHYAAQMCGPHNLNGKDPETGLDTLKKLVQNGASIQCRDKDGREPLLWAASAGSSEAVLVLFTAGASISTSDKDGLTALHCAASRGHTACVETLITLCGSKVDSGDHIGCSPLFYSSAQGQADCTQVLLKHGADPNRQDNKGRTPAHCAALKGRLEILRILDSNGADLWIRNSRGNLPLHEAVVSGRKDLVQWLLQQCPRAVNATNISGRTPLHIAAQRNNVEMCEVLIDYGAFINPLMVNAKGFLMTPLDASVYQGNQRCAKYLQLHGAVPATKVLENNEINRNLLFSLGNYAYSQKERSDEEPPSSAMFDPASLHTSNVRDAQTRTIRGGQQPPLLQAEVPPESELTNVISEEAADASVHIHLTRDDLWSLWESLMQELTSEMSGSELSQGSEQKPKLSRKTSDVRELKPILTNVYLRRESGRSQVITGESLLDKAASQIKVVTRSLSEDPRLRYPKRATDDFKATLPRVSEAEKSKSTEDDRNTASSRISGIVAKEEKDVNINADEDVFNYFTDSVGSDTENVTSITGTKATRLRKRRSDARPWVKELEESETSSANRQERREGNPYIKRYFQRQARAAEMRKYLETRNFQNEDEYREMRITKKKISEQFDDSKEYDDDDYDEESARLPPVDHKGKSKRSKKDIKYKVSTEGLSDELPSKSNKLRRSKTSTALNLDSIHSPRHTSKKRSKEPKHKLCDCIKYNEEKIGPENWHSEECPLKRRHSVETPRKSGRKKHGTSSTRDLGRKSSKNFLDVPYQHSAAASAEHSEDITEEEEMKHRHHHHHHHHHHYHHHHRHRSGSVTPEKEFDTSEDRDLERHHNHKRRYHRKKSGVHGKRYPIGERIERKIFSDGEYEQSDKDIYSGYNMPRSKSEMSDISWDGTRDALTQFHVPEVNEQEKSKTLRKDDDSTNISKSDYQQINREQQSKSSENFNEYEKSFRAKEVSDDSERRKSTTNTENETEKLSSRISQEKQKIRDSQESKDQNGHSEKSISVLRNVKERRESKKPGKPPFKSAQSFSGTLSQKTRDVPLKQKSRSARIEKDLPEIKIFSAEGDETNVLVRTDFELKDVSETSEITSNGDTFDKNKIVSTHELKKDIEVIMSDQKDISENERERTSDTLDTKDVAIIEDGKQINRGESRNSEIVTENHLEEKESDSQNNANNEIFIENEIAVTPDESKVPKSSEQNLLDTSEDELDSSNEDEPDEILYQDERYTSMTAGKNDEEIAQQMKDIEEKDENLSIPEIVKSSHSADNIQQLKDSTADKSEISDENLLRDETEKIYDLKKITSEKKNIETDNSEVKDVAHLTVSDKYDEEISVSNEENEEKSPYQSASVENESANNIKERVAVSEDEYSEQIKTAVENFENVTLDQTNADLPEKNIKNKDFDDIKIDENDSGFELLSHADDKSEYKKSKEIYENDTKIDNLESKQFYEENFENVDEQEKESLINEINELQEKHSEKSTEKMLSQLDEEKMAKSEEPETINHENQQIIEQNGERNKKPNKEECPTKIAISKSEVVMKVDEDKKKEIELDKDTKEEIELVEETARNHVLSIIQQAQSEIQKQFGTNALESQNLSMVTDEDDLHQKTLLESQNSFTNETIGINIIEATPNYEEPPFAGENVEFSEPESASEAETKFNTDSEDTQPEPDLDPELLSEEVQKNGEIIEETRTEPTPDLILLAQTLEAETRALAAKDEQQKKDLDRLEEQNKVHKERENERTEKNSVAYHIDDTGGKQKIHSKANHRRHSNAKFEEKEDENVNVYGRQRRKSKDDPHRDEEKDENVNRHGKHRRKSKDSHRRDSHEKHRRHSKSNNFIDKNEILEENVEEGKDVRPGILKDVQDLVLKDYDTELSKRVRYNIKENEYKYRKTLEEEADSLEKEENDYLNVDVKNQRKMSIVKKSEEIPQPQLTTENTISEGINVTSIDKETIFFPSAEVQTDITGETKLSEIGINVQKDISSHIGFHRSISVQTSDFDTSVMSVLEKVQKDEVPISTENHRTISIQTERSDLIVNPILDPSDEIKQAIRTANYNDISGNSRSLGTQCIDMPQSTSQNTQVKTVSVAVDASQRSPERHNPGAVFYTAHNKVNESPKKEKQNIGAVFYAAPSMNDRYDISSVSTPNLYTEQITRDKQEGGRGNIPRSTIRDRSLESERAVAIANTAFRRLNSKGELTVFNSSLITVPQNVPIPLAESKPVCRREHSNLEKSGFLWVHFGSGSSPISSIKRKPNFTSQKVKRESKLVQSHAIHRNIDEENETEATKMSSMNRMSRRNEIRSEGNSNIYSRTRTQRKTDETSKSQSTKSKSGLNEALHVSSKVLTNKTPRKTNLQALDKAMDDSNQNEMRSRIPHKYPDHEMNRRVGDISNYSEKSRIKKQNKSPSKDNRLEKAGNEPSPKRAIPRLCRDGSFIKSSSELADTPRVKIMKKHNDISDVHLKKELSDDTREMKSKPEIQHEKTNKGKGNLKLKQEIQNETVFNKFNQEEEFGDKKFYFDDAKSRTGENLHLAEKSGTKKSTRSDKKNWSRKQSNISNEINIDTSYDDYSFEKEELERFEKDEIELLAQENGDMEDVCVVQKSLKGERRSSSRKQADISNETDANNFHMDNSFEKKEFNKIVKEEVQEHASKPEAKKKSPKKSRKTSSGKKEKQSPIRKSKTNTESETSYFEIEETVKSSNVETDKIEKCYDKISKETEGFIEKKLEKDNQKVKVKNMKKEVRKKSETTGKDILGNNEADSTNFQDIVCEENTEDDITEEKKVQSSKTPRRKSSKNKRSQKLTEEDPCNQKNNQKKDEEKCIQSEISENPSTNDKHNVEKSPKRRVSSSSKRATQRNRDEEAYDEPKTIENESIIHKRNGDRSPKRRSSSSRKKSTQRNRDNEECDEPKIREDESTIDKSNEDKSPKRRKSSSRKKSNQKKRDGEGYNQPEKSENESTVINPNDDSHQRHPRLSETAKSSSLDEGDVKFVIERKKNPDFSIKISMKDKQKRSRKQKEPNNTDFSSTQYESDQSYVKDSGYISTTESVHRHRRSITIDLGHTRAKINAGMKNSSESYEEEKDNIRERVTLPDVEQRTEVADDDRSEQQTIKKPSNKVLRSKLPVLTSQPLRHGSNSVVLASYSRSPRKSSSRYMNGNDEEADSSNFDSNQRKDLKTKSPVRSDMGLRKVTKNLPTMILTSQSTVPSRRVICSNLDCLPPVSAVNH